PLIPAATGYAGAAGFARPVGAAGPAVAARAGDPLSRPLRAGAGDHVDPLTREGVLALTVAEDQGDVVGHAEVVVAQAEVEGVAGQGIVAVAVPRVEHHLAALRGRRLAGVQLAVVA